MTFIPKNTPFLILIEDVKPGDFLGFKNKKKEIVKTEQVLKIEPIENNYFNVTFIGKRGEYSIVMPGIKHAWLLWRKNLSPRENNKK